MANDDYRLKPDSPALALGFEPIPWEKIGLQGYPRAARLGSEEVEHERKTQRPCQPIQI